MAEKKPGGLTLHTATRMCGKCSTPHKITDGGGKRHPVYKWICAACAKPKKGTP